MRRLHIKVVVSLSPRFILSGFIFQFILLLTALLGQLISPLSHLFSLLNGNNLLSLC